MEEVNKINDDACYRDIALTVWWS